MKQFFKKTLLLVVLMSTLSVFSQEASFHNHSIYNSLLKKYVNTQGKVDYEGLKKEQKTLSSYITKLRDNTVKVSWSRENQLAYWINLYNALTLELVVKNYPLKSIMDIEKAWDTPLIVISGKQQTLNDIENKIIRSKYKEPRIHFAVNCAAKSCPKLLNEAFVGHKLDEQLEKQTKAFVNNSLYNQLYPNTIKVSKIFEWYRSDFGDLRAFLNQYSEITIQKNAVISYEEYNWQLNKQ